MRSVTGAVGTLLLGVLLLAAAPGAAAAQLQASGHLDLLAMAGEDERGLNRNFRGDSPFNEVRLRLFAQRWLTDRMGVFAEVLFDRVSGPRLNGAYMVVNDLGGKSWLDLRMGLAPSLVGNFGVRSTYYNSNPLIGVPLVWQHRTTLGGSGLATGADLLRRRNENVILLPMLYDACWNLQWELMGQWSDFEYSVGVTPGSMSNPLPTPDLEGVQLLARVGWAPGHGLRIGLSGGVGPYLGGPARDEVSGTAIPGAPEAYDQRLLGWDVEMATGKVQLFSEGYRSTWEVPLVEEDLTATGAYVEGRWDFLPRWFAALRVGGMAFSDIDVAEDARGPTGWDDDVLRVETSLTRRVVREVQVRLGWQHTRFLTGPEEPVNLLALQLRAVF